MVTWTHSQHLLLILWQSSNHLLIISDSSNMSSMADVHNLRSKTPSFLISAEPPVQVSVEIIVLNIQTNSQVWHTSVLNKLDQVVATSYTRTKAEVRTVRPASFCSCRTQNKSTRTTETRKKRRILTAFKQVFDALSLFLEKWKISSRIWYPSLEPISVDT